MQQARLEKMKRMQLTRKRNSMLFLMRMKHLASLPENKNAKFHIPVNLIPYGESLLSVQQVDDFIQYNNLIERVKLEINEEVVLDQDIQEALDISIMENYKNVSGAIQKKVKEVFFKVP